MVKAIKTQHPRIKVAKERHAPITAAIASKIIEVVNKGLVGGMIGDPVPGKMCVEAAVCYAMGEPHTEEPRCVDLVIRHIKIALNDMDWRTNLSRAYGLQRVAVAQLGTANLKGVGSFKDSLVQKIAGELLPPVIAEADWDKLAWLANGFEDFREDFRDHSDVDDFQSFFESVIRAKYNKQSTFADKDDAGKRWLAGLIEDVLVELKAPGTEFLHLCTVKRVPVKSRWPAPAMPKRRSK